MSQYYLHYQNELSQMINDNVYKISLKDVFSQLLSFGKCDVTMMRLIFDTCEICLFE